MINYWFIVWGTLTALNAIVGLADWLQGGIAWPVNLTALFVAAVVKVVTR